MKITREEFDENLLKRRGKWVFELFDLAVGEYVGLNLWTLFLYDIGRAYRNIKLVQSGENICRCFCVRENGQPQLGQIGSQMRDFYWCPIG